MSDLLIPGEPEIVFRVRSSNGEVRQTLKIWTGYFDGILNQHVPHEGRWRPLACQHHMEGWDTKEWTVPDLKEALDEWLLVDALQFDDETRHAFELVTQTFRYALSNEHSVSISKE